MANYITDETRGNLIAMLCGNVKKIEELIHANNNQPICIASVNWEDNNNSIDSYMFSYVLYDALLYDNDDKDYRGRNIPEMLDLHKRLCGSMKHPDYSKIPFINYNDIDYFDEEDVADLKKDGARDIDIELTNEGIQHNEERVVELLKQGASPYFFNRWNWCTNYQPCGYLEVAFLLCHLDSEWCDQWDLNSLKLLRKDPNTLDNEELERIMFDLFNAAASQRILYLVDKYIKDEERTKGEELMKKYDVLYPIIRFKPTET